MVYPSGSIGADIQELRAELERVEEIIDRLEPKIRDGERKLSVYREVVQVARTYLLLANRMGLPEDSEDLIRVGQRIIVIFNQMYRAGMLLFTSPVGAVIGIGSLALSQLYIMEGY